MCAAGTFRRIRGVADRGGDGAASGLTADRLPLPGADGKPTEGGW